MYICISIFLPTTLSTHIYEIYYLLFLCTDLWVLRPFCAQSLSHVWFFVAQWTVAHQAPLPIFQARVLERIAISYSRFKTFLCSVSHFSHVQFFVTPWTVAHQAPLFMGFPRQEYWSLLPFPSPGESSQPRDWTHVSYVSCICRRVL